jgi:hypothetical protein
MGPPPIPVPYIVQKKLKIMHFWASQRHYLNEAIDPALFNAAAIENYRKMMVYEAKEEDAVVKPPADFKTGTKWKPFKEGVIAYFNCIKDTHNIPLPYIIREQEVHGIVFDALKSWKLNGPAWTWLHTWNNTRHGKNAWLALVSDFEGDAQRDFVKDNAYASIAAAKYYGERKLSPSKCTL